MGRTTLYKRERLKVTVNKNIIKRKMGFATVQKDGSSRQPESSGGFSYSPGVTNQLFIKKKKTNFTCCAHHPCSILPNSQSQHFLCVFNFLIFSLNLAHLTSQPLYQRRKLFHLFHNIVLISFLHGFEDVTLTFNIFNFVLIKNIKS